MAEVSQVTMVLVAVNDSPAAFAAAEVAVAFATQLGAELRVVTVVDPASIPVDRRHTTIASLTAERETEAGAILKHVVALGASTGLTVTTSLRTGKIAVEILDEARAVAADMIVMASVDRPGHAIPKVGSHTMRVLEFASVPVLVVPGPATHNARRRL
jgi:nucleotide-binding universal stress UspA family protein